MILLRHCLVIAGFYQGTTPVRLRIVCIFTQVLVDSFDIRITQFETQAGLGTIFLRHSLVIASFCQDISQFDSGLYVFLFWHSHI